MLQRQMLHYTVFVVEQVRLSSLEHDLLMLVSTLR